MSNLLHYFHEFDFASFRDAVVLLDIDGTLVPDGAASLDEETVSALRRLNETNQVYFCSNKRVPGRLAAFTQMTGIPALSQRFRKPNKKVITELPQGRNSFIVVGDKLLIDGVFARNIGARFVKVRRKHHREDSWSVRLTYLLDDCCGLLYDVWYGA